MAKIEMSKFEKRRKGVETIFDIMFLIMLIVTIEDLVFGEYTGVELIFRIQSLVLLFACTRLAKDADIFAGVLGVIYGVLQFFLGGIIFKILGVLLIIDSIYYIILHAQIDGEKDAKTEKK